MKLEPLKAKSQELMIKSINNLSLSYNRGPKIRERVIDEYFSLLAIQEAFRAAEKGNYGVGGILVVFEKDLKEPLMVLTGQNKVFSQGISDNHAEMMAVSEYEATFSKARRQDHALVMYTSIESCPMCWARQITAGISICKHVADDPPGGMVNFAKSINAASPNQPLSVWLDLSKNVSFEKAHVNPEISELALGIFMATKDNADKAISHNNNSINHQDVQKMLISDTMFNFINKKQR